MAIFNSYVCLPEGKIEGTAVQKKMSEINNPWLELISSLLWHPQYMALVDGMGLGV